jgi:hypothetical protein
MVSRVPVLDEEWETLVCEHVDWNDIVEAELSDNAASASDELSFLT